MHTVQVQTHTTSHNDSIMNAFPSGSRGYFQHTRARRLTHNTLNIMSLMFRPFSTVVNRQNALFMSMCE